MHWDTLHPVTLHPCLFSPPHFCSLGPKPLFLCFPKLLAFCKRSAAILGDDGVRFAAAGEASQRLDPPKFWQRWLWVPPQPSPASAGSRAPAWAASTFLLAIKLLWMGAGLLLARLWHASGKGAWPQALRHR